MEFREILRMAFGSLGVNKLRSFLTMSGISIGVFSVIGVMTAVSALRGSIETGLSVLGSNIFQISRNPTGFQTSGTRAAGSSSGVTLRSSRPSATSSCCAT